MKRTVIKRTSFVVAAVAALATAAAALAQVRDWHDLAAVHDQVLASIQELNRARAANHYDMAGHGAKAEAALHEAERQLRLAIDAMKAGR
jgi:hypothetical protein